ncbi:MAG: FAD-dependent oxidoreductase [Planctomycetota bacterium]|mgnify:CR=1 FL=1
MRRTADVAVVGAGIYGCAIAHALSARRLRVAVLERESEPAAGPTRRSGACTRQFYGDPRLSALSRESLELAWNRWSAFTGLRDPEAEHDRCGTVVVAPPASARGLSIIHLPPRVDAIDLFAANLRAGGTTAFETLGSPELARRFPFMRSRGLRGLWERDSGYMREPSGAARDLARAARARGATFHFGRPATRVRHTGSGWSVETPAGPVACGSLILAAGAWTAALLPFPLRRHTLRVARVRTSFLGGLPGPHPVVCDVAGGAYFRRRGAGLFAANLAAEPATLRRPDDLDPRCDRYPLAERAARNRFGSLAHAIPSGAATIYDVNRLDGNPVVDQIAPGLFCAWLFSGHGFKFAPAVAARLAEAVAADATPRSLEAFAEARTTGVS